MKIRGKRASVCKSPETGPKLACLRTVVGSGQIMLIFAGHGKKLRFYSKCDEKLSGVFKKQEKERDDLIYVF